jgi:hypothetical protein
VHHTPGSAGPALELTILLTRSLDLHSQYTTFLHLPLHSPNSQPCLLTLPQSSLPLSRPPTGPPSAVNRLLPAQLGSHCLHARVLHIWLHVSS